MYSCGVLCLQGPRCGRARAVRLEAALDGAVGRVHHVSLPTVAHRARNQGSDPALWRRQNRLKSLPPVPTRQPLQSSDCCFARAVLTDIRPLQARQPAPRAAPAAIPPSHSWVPRAAERTSPREHDRVARVAAHGFGEGAPRVASGARGQGRGGAEVPEGRPKQIQQWATCLESRAATRRSSRRRRPCRIRRKQDGASSTTTTTTTKTTSAPAPPKPPSPKPDASMSDLFGADSDEDQTEKKEEAHKMEDLFGADSDEDKPAESKHRMEDLFGDDDEDEPAAAPVEAPLQRKLHRRSGCW